MGRRNGRIQATATIGVLLTLQSAAAQTTDPTLQVLTPRFVERASGFPSRSPCGNAACASSARLPPMELRARSSFDAVIVETRPDDLRGQSRRPRLSFGMRSHALEAALDSAGLAARHCLAPVVRMNTRMSGSPGLSGTLWISFRCSFD